MLKIDRSWIFLVCSYANCVRKCSARTKPSEAIGLATRRSRAALSHDLIIWSSTHMKTTTYSRIHFFPLNPTIIHKFENSTMDSRSRRKTKVHECSICHRIFSSGQALGGHKRCHQITSNAAAKAPPPPSIAKIHQYQFHDHRVPPPPFDSNSTVVLLLELKLDLNLPALADEVRRPAFEVSTQIYLQSYKLTVSKQ